MEKETDIKIDVELRKTFARRLKRLRTDKGLTLEEFAKILRDKYGIGATYGSIGNYERSTRIPDLFIISKIANYFDVSTDYLMGIVDEKNSKAIQTNLFDEKNVEHNVKIVFDKNSSLANMSLKEIQELVIELRNSGIDFDKIK